MNKNDFIRLITQLPDNVDITVQTCSYDGNSDVYDDQEPRLIVGENLAILTGNRDYYAQRNAASWLSNLGTTTIQRLLKENTPIVKVD